MDGLKNLLDYLQLEISIVFKIIWSVFGVDFWLLMLMIEWKKFKAGQNYSAVIYSSDFLKSFRRIVLKLHRNSSKRWTRNCFKNFHLLNSFRHFPRFFFSNMPSEISLENPPTFLQGCIWKFSKSLKKNW